MINQTLFHLRVFLKITHGLWDEFTVKNLSKLGSRRGTLTKDIKIVFDGNSAGVNWHALPWRTGPTMTSRPGGEAISKDDLGLLGLECDAGLSGRTVPCDSVRPHFTVSVNGRFKGEFNSRAFEFQSSEPPARRSARSQLRHQRRHLRTLGLFRKECRRALGFLWPRKFCVRRLSLQAEQSSRDPSSLRGLEIWGYRGLPSGRQPYSEACRNIGRWGPRIRGFGVSLRPVRKGRMARVAALC